MKARTDFDQFADSYDRALGEALAASGENRRYFAEGRVKWVAECMKRLEFQPQSVMDYGCGTGSTTPLLLELARAERAVGVDTSLRSLDVARRDHASQAIQFMATEQFRPAGDLDLVYCNGVFHHIPPALRAGAANFIFRSLKPGGYFALWENNPWNPGTRYVMAHCAFDGDAITLTPPEAARTLRSEGFRTAPVNFLFVFPRFLSLLRPMERFLTRLPLGGQYLVLAQKPAANH
jgi:SAM-dependent methyltransferase